VKDIDFKVISATENSNKFQKTRFWKENSVEDLVTLWPTAQATLVWSKIALHSTPLTVLKPQIYLLQPQGTN
jgi:hypothetical protein